ncbi:MAG: 3-phosphoglycerate dehydrogenase [Ruminococcaceae bacterium]|nr:3-phosphoglycerate dehydrogenase [Oscillospiraceae bacterium]
MKIVQTMNKIAPVGLKELDPKKYAITDSTENPDAIMVRSANLNAMEFGYKLTAIVRCGAGVNNIPVDRCAEQGIVVFNTPGANANGVKELTIASLLLASRNIVGGIEWAKTLTEDVAKQVEKGKGAFAGCEIHGKTLGVIGLGAIGGMVANSAKSLGMKVIGCDPYITIEAAWHLSRSINKASTYDEIYENADYITLHIPATKDTKGMINKESIAKMKDGVKIINLSRADLVNFDDLREALESGKVSAYVTDFPNEEIKGCKNAIAIPHLGASTAESEDNCAVMAAHELDDFLTNGNITNSVNYPSISMPRIVDGGRLVILHKNVPNILSSITSHISAEGINIENMANRSRGNYACTLIDTPEHASDKLIEKISEIDNIIRIIKVD